MNAQSQTPKPAASAEEVTVVAEVVLLVKARFPWSVAARMTRKDLSESLSEALTIHSLDLPLTVWGEQVGEATKAECRPSEGALTEENLGLAHVSHPGFFPRR